MQYIATTATTVEKLKARAKALQQEKALPRHAALEAAAREAEYDSWFHVSWCLKQRPADGVRATETPGAEDRFIADAHAYMAYLARKGAVPVTSYPTRGDVFHEVEIEGICFRGAVGIDGPAIIRRSARLRGYEQGWVQLGVAKIFRVPYFSPSIARAQQTEPIGHRWWVCKYGASEERIKIDDLSPAGRHALAHEFGIVLNYPSREADPDAMYFGGGEWFLFYLSPAFGSLCQWAKKHPRKARDCRGSYLGDWVNAAMIGEYVFARDKS